MKLRKNSWFHAFFVIYTYFEEFSKLLAQEETITWFRREFTREALLDRFRNGETTMAFTYSIRYADGLRWRQAILIMPRRVRYAWKH